MVQPHIKACCCELVLRCWVGNTYIPVVELDIIVRLSSKAKHLCFGCIIHHVEDVRMGRTTMVRFCRIEVSWAGL